MRSGSLRLNQELRDLIEVVRTADLRDEDASDIAEVLRDISERLRPYVVDSKNQSSAGSYMPSRRRRVRLMRGGAVTTLGIVCSQKCFS